MYAEELKAKLYELYTNGLTLQAQLNAFTMSVHFFNSKELGVFYAEKALAEARLDENNEEFEKALNYIKQN